MTDKKEIKFIICWSIFISLLVFLPIIYGYFSATPEKIFVGSTPSIPIADVNSYFAWIKQAQEGSFLFEDKFTSEPHHAWFFHPVFLLIGFLSKALHLNVEFFWHSAAIISNFVLFLVIYFFISSFFPPAGETKNISKPEQSKNDLSNNEKEKSNRRLTEFRLVSFIIITISSGFGWILGQRSADSWLTELTIFRSMRWPFIFSMAITLILLIFLSVLKAEKTGKTKFIAYAGILALLLILIHPYDIIIVLAVIIPYLLISGFFRKEIRKSFLKIAIFLVLISPGVLYNFYVMTFDPVFGAHGKTAMLSPNPLSYLLGFGLLAPLGALGIIFTFLNIRRLNEQNKRNLSFLALWIFISLILAYSPFNFQRKMIIGIQIPLAIFATIGLYEIIKKNRYKYLLTAAVIGFLSFSNTIFLTNDFLILKERNFPFFIDKSFKESMDWLDKNAASRDIILSSPASGNFIPRFTGKTAYTGHWAQTINADQKKQKVEKFYSLAAPKENLESFVSTNSIDYIFCSDLEYECKDENWQKKLLSVSNIALVFDNQYVKIYKVSTPK